MAVFKENVVIQEGPLKRIHINTLELRKCVKAKTDEPCLIVRVGDKRFYGRDVQINGPSRLIQSLSKPMPGCGARIWIESTAEVVVDIAQPSVPDTCELV